MRAPAYSLLGLLLAGCVSATDYERPAVRLPDAYPHAAVGSDAALSRAWWEVYGIEDLNRLVDRVLATNRELGQAALTARRAHLEAGLAADEGWPHATGGVTGQRTWEGKTTADRSSAALDITWEVDLWRRIAASAEAARWTARATDEDWAATRLSLTASTVNLYWRLADLNDSIASGAASVAYAERVLDLVRARHAAGAASGLEVTEALQSVEQQRTEQSSRLQSRVEARNTLLTLLGGADPDTVPEPAGLPPGAPPGPPAALPAAVLEARPDIRAAENRLLGDLAQTDAQRAAFLPTLTLTGEAGGSSVELRRVLANPALVLGASVSLPFLDWRKRVLSLKIARVDYERQVAAYQQTVLQAFAEVDNALSNATRLAEQASSAQAAYEAATRAEALYALRYRAGAVTFRTWLDAQEARRTAARSLADTRRRQYEASVTLSKALGGGASPGG